jgi:hypothetical protein
MKLVPGKIYKFDVTNQLGGARKNQVTTTEHRGKFISEDLDFYNFHLLPGAEKFIKYKVKKGIVSNINTAR